MKLEAVNGDLLSLRGDGGFGGFRKYCKEKADALNVTGYVQGILNRDMFIFFEGSPHQCKLYHNFLKMCRSQGMIGAITDIKKSTQQETYYGDFAIVRSYSKRATRGRYSDPEHDKRSTYSYGDARDIVASPDNSNNDED